MKLATPLGAILALALTVPALAQDAGSRFAATTLDLTGHGEAHVPPDMATIELGVTSSAPTAAQAMQDNAAAMTKVVAALKAGGIAAKDIATANLSVMPQYAYAQGAPPRLTGYEAENQVRITVQELSRLGPALDAVVAAGATNVGQISFGLKSRASAENFARLAAVKQLEDKAALYADAAGYHIRRLVNLSESSTVQPLPIRRFAQMQAAAAPAAATPIEAGEIVVSVDVAGEFELTR
ncbi:MAG TPA: SIMPL domain-containing protein [Caulobacteraceae bacterium]|nr:SIMPL domain-containing protein [Caulobacteraceae bacterium]